MCLCVLASYVEPVSQDSGLHWELPMQCLECSNIYLLLIPFILAGVHGSGVLASEG